MEALTYRIYLYLLACPDLTAVRGEILVTIRLLP
jgi:hypothetical protein